MVKKNLRKKARGKIFAVLLAVMLIVSCMPAGIAFAAGTAPTNTLAFSPNGGSIYTTTPITITAAPDLSTSEAVYWNTTGSTLSTSDNLYQSTGLNLSVSGTVYAAVYDSSTGLWGTQTSATFTVSAPPPTAPTNTLAFSPNGGSIYTTTPITITAAPDLSVDQSVYYTTDGSTPTYGSTWYNGSFTLPTGSSTVEAIVYDSSTGLSSSATVADFTITTAPGAPTAPTFSASTGTYNTAQTETIGLGTGDSSVSDSVYYTTNGTTPTKSSTEYTVPLTVSASETVEAIVYDSSTGLSSSATVADFTINLPTLSSDDTLSALTVSSGTLSPVFAAGATTYNVVLPAGTTTVPTVTATATNSNATAVVTQAVSLPGSATVVVTAQNGTTTQTYTINFSVAVLQTVTTTSTTVDVNSTTSEQITVPETVTDATLNLISTSTVSANGTTTYTLSQVTVTSATSQGSVGVTIPYGTTVTGSSTTWNDQINLPQVVTTSSITVTPVSGYTPSVSEAIELGSNNTELYFSQPVRILLAGQGGKLVGWIGSGSSTFNTTYQMASDSAAALGSNQVGYLTVGNDLVIWTTHFTTFVAYTETVISSSPSGGGGGTSSYSYAPTVQTEAALN